MVQSQVLDRTFSALSDPTRRDILEHLTGGPASISELELSQAAQKAVALAQQEKSAWTRADLVKYLGRVLPGPG